MYFIGIKDTKNLNPSSTLAELGMDSLMGGEIKQTLERNFDTVLSVGEIRNLTMGKLMELQGAGGAAAGVSAEELSVQTVQIKRQVFASRCNHEGSYLKGA